MCTWRKSQKDRDDLKRRRRRRSNRPWRTIVVLSPNGSLAKFSKVSIRPERNISGPLSQQQLQSVARGLHHLRSCQGACNRPICRSTKQFLRKLSRHQRRQQEDGHDRDRCRACAVLEQIRCLQQTMGICSSCSRQCKRPSCQDRPVHD